MSTMKSDIIIDTITWAKSDSLIPEVLVCVCVLALLLAAVPGVFPVTAVVRVSLKSFLVGAILYLLADHKRRGLPPTRL